MSFFDDASLVMIPSGYKTSKVYSVKPTDGSGDLAFTRSNDTATRVGPDGLIEKVRTNVSFYSEQFDNGFWTKLGTALTVTANTTIAPNGTLTADTLNVSNNNNVLYGVRSIALAGNEFTFSIYAKGTGTFVMNVRLNSLTTTTETKTLTSDWQRFSVSVTNAVPVVSVEFYIDLNTSSTYNVWGAQVESSPVATDYIATTTAAVSVGPVANVPRLDYLNSSCPRLLLEPQRTNLITFSEQFNNAAWSTGNATVTANQTISPDGYINADKLAASIATTTNPAELIQSTTQAANTAHSYSVYAKKSTSNFIALRLTSVAGNPYVWFNLNTGTVGTVQSGLTGSIVSAGNGWYRCTVTGTTEAVIGVNRVDIAVSDNNGNFVCAINGSIFLYGCQVEAGAYATSYIPTLGASVTRGADAASKTGISSLIGQTEGTLFADITLPTMANIGANLVSMSLFNSGLTVSTGFDIYDSGNLYAFHVNGTAQASILKTGFTAGRHKVAFGYKANNFVLYVDGALVGTDTSGTVGAQDSFGLQYGTSQFIGQQYVSQALLFKTRLTNAQLAELTTI